MDRRIRLTAESIDMALHVIAQKLAFLVEEGVLEKDIGVDIIDRLSDRFGIWCLLKMGLDDAKKFFKKLNEEA